MSNYKTNSSFNYFVYCIFNKLFIFISHADGKNPEGSLAKFVKYDADVKIRVEGYRAMCLSRLGGDKEPYTIWEQGAAQFDLKIK